MAKVEEKKKDNRGGQNKKHINTQRPGIRVEKELYDDLKILCIKNNITIQDLTIQFYEAYVESQKAKFKGE